ncbi:MAG TPA: helix-turn-helix domain-containing protein [Bryobacteraceae bacterium]|nr:helix-turn-helix domain-containing protein [Bryobacteraceae bacterium]
MKENFDTLVQHLLNGGIFLGQAIEILEKRMIESALERRRGNQSAVAKCLGIHRNTLQRKMAEYGLDSGRARARRKPVVREMPARRRKSGAA